jgi:hypothetical protein
MNLKQYLTYFMLFNAMLGSSATVHATSVSVMGLFKDKAIVSIDGGKAHTMSVGQILQGVKLVSSHSAEASFEVDGARRALGMGQSFAGNPQSDSRASVSLTADVRGHFMAGGSLNSYPVSFLVDTGATSIAISGVEARRMGLDYKAGPAQSSRRDCCGIRFGYAFAWHELFEPDGDETGWANDDVNAALLKVLEFSYWILLLVVAECDSIT